MDGGSAVEEVDRPDLRARVPRGQLQPHEPAAGRTRRREATEGSITMRTTFAVIVALGASLAAAPLLAHHAFSSEFDINKPLKLTGTLTKWEMINPHSWFHMDIKQPDGTIVPWLVEGGSPNQLIRLGVTKNTLKVGTEFTIEGYQARDGTNKAVGRNFILADGSRYLFGGSAPGAGGADK